MAVISAIAWSPRLFPLDFGRLVGWLDPLWFSFLSHSFLVVKWSRPRSGSTVKLS